MGIGRSDREGNERDWSSKGHLVSVGRISSSKARMMLLEYQSIAFAESLRCSLFSVLAKRYKRSKEEEESYHSQLKDLALRRDMDSMSEEEKISTLERDLSNQLSLQHKWFEAQETEDGKRSPVHLHRQIYQSLLEEMRFEQTLHREKEAIEGSLLTEVEGTNPDIIRLYQCITESGGLAGYTSTCKCMNQLLQEANMTRNDWSQHGPLWCKYENFKV